ncbi:MAG: Flp family type IVb pilin [Atopobiaceae bacterium]
MLFDQFFSFIKTCLNKLGEERGQGTTEYAILVGVLVVIAILAIIAFRDRVSSLWQAIADGINSL